MFEEIVAHYQGEYGAFHPFGASGKEVWESVSDEKKQKLIRLGEGYKDYTYPVLPAMRFMDFCRNGNRTRYQEPFHARRNVVSVLTLAECAERKGRFLEDIVNGVMAICEESGWQAPAHNIYPDGGYKNKKAGESAGKPVRRSVRCLPDEEEPVMDLYSGETGVCLALTLWLLRDELDGISPLIRERAERELKKRVVEPFLSCSYWWMCDHGEMANNWTAWCTQNTLIAVFSMEGISQETKRAVAQKAARCLDRFAATYGTDGCCNEGAGYYHHAGLTLFGCLEVLNTVTGGAFSSLYEEPLIRNMAAYIMNVHVEDQYYINFADCAPKLERAGAREYVFGKRTRNEDMMRYAVLDHRKDRKSVSHESWQNLWYQLLEIFTEPEMEAMDLSEPVNKQDVYYDSTGLLLMRDSRFCLAAKAGNNNDSHNHNDVGSITLYYKGKPMLIDVGVETYTSKTFSDQRYEIWTMQSAYHNVMTFADAAGEEAGAAEDLAGGREQAAALTERMQLPGREYQAKVRYVKVPGRKAAGDLPEPDLFAGWDGGMEMELAGAYEPGAVDSWVRFVGMKKEEEILVRETWNHLKKGSYLTLMVREKPRWKDGVLSLPHQPDICFNGAEGAVVETIRMEDEKLQKNWDTDTIYRVKIYPQGAAMEWSIKNLELV